MRCVGNRTYAIEWLEMDETKSVQRKTGYQSSKRKRAKPSAIGNRQSAGVNYFHGNAPRAVAFSAKCSLKSRSAARWGPQIAISQLQSPSSNVQCPPMRHPTQLVSTDIGSTSALLAFFRAFRRSAAQYRGHWEKLECSREVVR